MTDNDEPILDNLNGKKPAPAENDPAIELRIRRLCEQQRFGVLCTQGQGQPYGSMIAFVTTDDLKYVVFATPKATRKYRLLTECHNVALVVNNRDESHNDLAKTEAFTATGKATEITAEAEFSTWAKMLREKHPYLESFVASPSTALFKIAIVRYFHVHRFQEVRQWTPGEQ